MIVSSNLLPDFAEIVNLIIYNKDNILLAVRTLTTTVFVAHLHSFEVVRPSTDNFTVLKPTDLLDPVPLSLYQLTNSPNCSYVTLKYYIVENID